MRAVVIAASLTLSLMGAPGVAQTPPAAPAQTPPAQTAPAPPQPSRPFPEGAKVAYINFQRVASESIEGKVSTTKVQALTQKKGTELNDRNKALQANQQKLQQSGTVMSESARSQLEKEIERQQVELQRLQQDAQADVQDLQQELQIEFQKKLSPIVQQIATEKGLLILFSQADSGIVWADPGLDVTADVIKRFDAVTAVAPKTEAPKTEAPKPPAPKPPLP